MNKEEFEKNGTLKEVKLESFDPSEHLKKAQNEFWEGIEYSIKAAFREMMISSYASFFNSEGKIPLYKEKDITKNWQDFLKICSNDIVNIISQLLQAKALLKAEVKDDDVYFAFSFHKKKENSNGDGLDE